MRDLLNFFCVVSTSRLANSHDNAVLSSPYVGYPKARRETEEVRFDAIKILLSATKEAVFTRNPRARIPRARKHSVRFAYRHDDKIVCLSLSFFRQARGLLRCLGLFVAFVRIRGKTTARSRSGGGGGGRRRSCDAGNGFRSETEEAGEDLAFLRDRDAGGFNRADSETLFLVARPSQRQLRRKTQKISRDHVVFKILIARIKEFA